MPTDKPSVLIKPTLDTKFHIDYTWWERSPEDLNIYMLSHLLPEQRDQLSQVDTSEVVDYIDAITGEVFQLDQLQLAIQVAAEDQNFINAQTSLVDSVFRVFLANGNLPLNSRELAERTERPAATILKTFSTMRIYKGIRPLENE
ncbi:MAG: hypothetical protein H6672_11510 [Anaerolineaceae bacterium]|nr:hypothetical protein [Anaerolineaceae bacterium]